jgi:hypothetical protein
MKATNALLLAVATFAAGIGIGFYVGRAYPANTYVREQTEATKTGIR